MENSEEFFDFNKVNETFLTVYKTSSINSDANASFSSINSDASTSLTGNTNK